ncbi:MAG: hypothetical protein V3W04_05955 [Gammaproteobacteria bacterium]
MMASAGVINQQESDRKLADLIALEDALRAQAEQKQRADRAVNAIEKPKDPVPIPARKRRSFQ